MKPSVTLTKHEGETFVGQTIFVSGQAFVNCKFEGCTLILTNVASVIQRCRFDKCNWNLNYQILWGDPSTRQMLRSLLDLIEGKSDVVDSRNVH